MGIFVRSVLLIFGFLVFLELALDEAVAQERKLSFYQTHTKERLSLIYKKDGSYIEESLKKINHIFRDHRKNEVHPIDPELLDFLYDLLVKVNYDGEVHIISAYRSPKTNKHLRGRNKKTGVAKGSLHMAGKALDFRLPGVRTKLLREKALEMKRGGVGYYPKLDFIQIDTGRVRFW